MNCQHLNAEADIIIVYTSKYNCQMQALQEHMNKLRKLIRPKLQKKHIYIQAVTDFCGVKDVLLVLLLSRSVSDSHLSACVWACTRDW